MVSVSKAQGTDRNPVPVRINDEFSLIPTTAARMGTPPSIPGKTLFGLAVATSSESIVDVVDINTRRDAGSQLIAGLQTSAISELTIDETRLVPGDKTTLALRQDPTGDDPFDNLNDGTTFFTTIFVPSDSVRLVAEVAETTAVTVQLFVGQGLVPSADSLVCDGGAAAYCNIASPAKGEWWILVQNRAETAVSPDSITLSQAVVTWQESLCSYWDDDCLEALQTCLANGSFDSCWLALVDCFPEGMNAEALAELKACLFAGGNDDCLDEWSDCFPDWSALDTVLNHISVNGVNHDPDDDDCDEAHEYDNHHEDDHFTHHERCQWTYTWTKNMWVEGPVSVGEMEPFDLRVFWDEPDITAGDIWYGAFEMGSDPSHSGDLGTFSVDLNRFEDDVVKQVSAATAVPGDLLTYTISIQPNITHEELTYTITDTIPAGMTYVPGSASATGGEVSVTGNVITWTGPTSVPGFTYRIDTSATNPACTVFSAAADGVADSYLDLAAIGIYPDPTIFGDSVWYQAEFTGGEFHLFGLPQGSFLNFTDDGFLFLSGSGPGTTPQIHQPIPDPNDPNNLLAVLWRDMEIVYDGTRGATLVRLADSQNQMVGAIIEFDGMQDRSSAATFDFEAVAFFNADPNRYEYIFAYNNLTQPVALGTIGLENATGTLGVQYGYDDLALTDGMAICFDQVGSGETAVSISYQARVDDNAFGKLSNQAVHNTDNLGSKEAIASVDVNVYGDSLFLSGSSGGLAGKVAYADEDILRYNLNTGEWSLFLDGSDVGLKATDVDALHVLDDGSILLSLSNRLKIPGFGKVDDSDIIRFVPASLGEDSAGTFEMYFDGSDYGLSRSSEDVDAIGFAVDGRLVVGTTGSFKVPTNQTLAQCWHGLDAAANYFDSRSRCGQLRGGDEDLIVLDANGYGWDIYFDGSDVLGRRIGLGDTWIDPISGDVYLSLNGELNIGALGITPEDIFVCQPDSLGSDTACTFENQLFFDGAKSGLGGARIDGFSVSD
ncbi:MAG: DUF11 domain-containing protein [Ardenticatenaceae bacterium]|nr:DUF11 domain-containing protein [Ardenticatenaceae bacterium]